MNSFFKQCFVLAGLLAAVVMYQSTVYAMSEKPGKFTIDDKRSATLRLAKQDDVGLLLYHFAMIANDPLDSKKLVVFPEEVRKTILLDNIKDKKIFVAVDANDDKCVLAFTKMYVMQPLEVEGTLKNEIRCIGPNARLRDGKPFTQTDKQVCVYFGSQYTEPSIRQHHLGLALVEYGFHCLVDNIKEQQPEEIVMVYGKADGGQDATLPKRAFAYLLQQFGFETGFPFNVSTYHARMPVLQFDKERGVYDAREGQPLTDHGIVLWAPVKV